MIRTFIRLIRQSLRDMTLTPWAQVLTLTAVTMVAFLVGLFLMVITTLNDQLSSIKGETVFQVYWQPGLNEKGIRDQWNQIQEMSGFYGMKTFTADEALKEMGRRLDRTPDAKSFPFLQNNNPLPATALLTFVPTSQDYGLWLQETEQYLKDLPGVQRVSSAQLNEKLGETWQSINRMIMKPAIVFLLVLMGLVVGNTIRLSLIAKAREVEILKLVGAYNWYIRMPLLVGGALQGLLGSALALVLLRGLYLKLYDMFANLEPVALDIKFLPQDSIGLMLLIPALTGIIGGWIGLKR